MFKFSKSSCTLGSIRLGRSGDTLQNIDNAECHSAERHCTQNGRIAEIGNKPIVPSSLIKLCNH